MGANEKSMKFAKLVSKIDDPAKTFETRRRAANALLRLTGHSSRAVRVCKRLAKLMMGNSEDAEIRRLGMALLEYTMKLPAGSQQNPEPVEPSEPGDVPEVEGSDSSDEIEDSVATEKAPAPTALKEKKYPPHTPALKPHINWGDSVSRIEGLERLDHASPKLIYDALHFSTDRAMDDILEREVVAAVKSYAALAIDGGDIRIRLRARFDVETLDHPYWEQIEKQIEREIQDIAVSSADPIQPRWRVADDGESFATLTAYGEEFFKKFQRILDERIAAVRGSRKTSAPVAIEASPMVPREHGSPEGLPTHDITPDPAKSILPAVALHEPLHGIRATCVVCQATHGHESLPHDCRAYQI